MYELSSEHLYKVTSLLQLQFNNYYNLFQL